MMARLNLKNSSSLYKLNGKHSILRFFGFF